MCGLNIRTKFLQLPTKKCFRETKIVFLEDPAHTFKLWSRGRGGTGTMGGGIGGCLCGIAGCGTSGGGVLGVFRGMLRIGICGSGGISGAGLHKGTSGTGVIQRKKNT